MPSDEEDMAGGTPVKGWFDPKTGEAYLYLPAGEGVRDAIQTVLHEIVGHRGMRSLVGEESYNAFLQRVYDGMDKEGKAAVDKLRERLGCDRLTAMDETLAARAEADRKPSWWGQVKSAVRELLRNLGLDLDVTDADIDYMLWRSRRNLKGDRGGLLDRASDVALRRRARLARKEADDTSKSGVRFREDDEELVKRRKAIEGITPTDADKALRELSEREGKPVTLDEATAKRLYKALPDATNKQDGRTVKFYNTAFGKVMRLSTRNDFIRSIPALPEVFSNSVLAYSEEDNLGGTRRPDGTIHKEHTNIGAFHNYVGKVSIDGKDYYVRFTVTERKGDGESGLHSAFVSDIALYNKEEATPTSPVLPGLGIRGQENEGIADAKLRNFFDRTREAEKNLTESGVKKPKEGENGGIGATEAELDALAREWAKANSEYSEDNLARKKEIEERVNAIFDEGERKAGEEKNDTSKPGVRFREDDEERKRIREANGRFNSELQRQIDGTLPQGHVYQLGNPGNILKACGFPDKRIELTAARLAGKAAQRNHEFEISDMRNLVEALNDPIAVFSYGDRNKAQNAIVELERDGKKFLAGVHFDVDKDGAEVNIIKGLFNKDTAKWLNWISQGKSIYLNKEKIQAVVNKQRTNSADVEYLNLDSVAKVIENFENPILPGENLTESGVKKPKEDGSGGSQVSEAWWTGGSSREDTGRISTTQEGRNGRTRRQGNWRRDWA